MDFSKEFPHPLLQGEIKIDQREKIEPKVKRLPVMTSGQGAYQRVKYGAKLFQVSSNEYPAADILTERDQSIFFCCLPSNAWFSYRFLSKRDKAEVMSLTITAPAVKWLLLTRGHWVSLDSLSKEQRNPRVSE
jgi:hypothetical protein